MNSNSDVAYCTPTTSPAPLYGRSSVVESGDALYAGGYRNADAEEIFGAHSTLVEAERASVVEASFTTSSLYGGLVLASLIFYLYILLRSWRFVLSSWDLWNGKASERKLADEGGVLNLAHFNTLVIILGLVAMALMMVRAADDYTLLSSNAPAFINATTAPLIALLFTLVGVAWQYALHSVAGWLTRSEAVGMLAVVSRSNLVRAIIVVYPLAAAWMVSPVDLASTWTTLLVVALVPPAILYLKDTLQLFFDKKISILYWILYLCGAILLPVSFIIRIVE